MIDTAASLRIERLYHYQSFVKPERIARIFTEGTLYFSKARDFNDPWDCRPFFNKTGLDDADEYEKTIRWFLNRDRRAKSALSPEELSRREQELRANRRLLEYLIDQMSLGIESAIQRQYRVFCLSTHPDSTLMWAHYSDSCKGVCLEFDVKNELFCCALPVEYLGCYPLFTLGAEGDYEDIRPLLTKADAWQYENEFRLVATEYPAVFDGVPTTRDGYLPFPKEALKAIIIGPLMPSSERDLIRSLVEASGWDVEVKLASLVPDRYSLEIVRLVE